MPGQYDLGSLSGVLGQDIYNSLFSSQGFEGFGDGYGGSGSKANPWMTEGGVGESGEMNWLGAPNENALNAFNDYSFNWTPTGGEGGTLEVFNPSGQPYGTYQQKDEDTFTKLVGAVAPAIASWGFGGALSGLFGGGALGGAAGHGLASGAMSSMQGGSFGKGFLSGAVGGGLRGLAQGTPSVMGNNPSAFVRGTPGTSLAGAAGITNPTLAGMFNRGAGSVLGGLASGQSGSEALKGGLTGAALSGINSVGSNVMGSYMDSLKNWMGSGTTDMTGFDELQGSGGDMSDFTDVSPNRYDEMLTGSDGMSTYNPDFGFGGDQLVNSFPSADQSIQSATGQLPLASLFGNVGSNMGNFALNNAGDLASMLYGFYNNRKQQKALGQQISGLQSLYGQNSPYAQQLRNKLNAQAAATGRRSNVAGRETQLQAMLADRNAQMSPHLMQLNQARGGLKNNNMNMLLQGANKLGLFSGLGSLFQNNNPFANYSMANNTSDYNSLGIGRP